MATPKKAAKSAPKAKKSAAPKAKIAKKAAPAKKVAKAAAKKSVPAKKVVKAIAKKPSPKPAAKKPMKSKTVAKSVPSKPVAKTVTAAKSFVKPVVKPVTKPAAKPVVSVKSKTATPAEKTNTASPKKPSKPAQKSIVSVAPPAKPVKPVNPNAIKATAKDVRDIKVIPPKPVAIPKTTTKSTRTYQPDFTKSVLDQPKIDLGASITRYNDSELSEFRELIQRKLEAAKKEITYLQGLITRKDEMGGDESENRYMTMEDGSLSMEREQLSQMASRQITYIDHLEKALMRIENKTYGICRVTGKLIDKARLRAVPHATLSIEAKMGTIK